MDAGEAKRRIEAARILRGITQEEMSRRGAADYGLGAQELGRTERGGLEFTEARKLVLCKVLGVPDTWFSAPVDELLNGTPSSAGSVNLDDLREVLGDLLGGLDLAGGQDSSGTTRPEDGDDHPGGRAEGSSA